MKEIKLLLWGIDFILMGLAIFLAGIWFGSKMAIVVFFVLWASSMDSKLKGDEL